MQRGPSDPCPVCANLFGNLVLDHRECIPTLQNVTLKTREEALHFPTGKLKIFWCAQCSFVWNEDFDPDKISYNDGYNNDVTYSGYYVAHLENMADRIVNSVPQNQSIHYVEIGCGEADFLRLVVERAKGRCVSATGFDPSFSSTEKLPDGAVVHRSFFGADQLPLVPEATNVICSRHTIEHVQDVQSFVRALAAPVTTYSRTLFVETPDANWILRHTAFQDFFYEHCSIYTPDAIELILNTHGLSAKTAPVYGTQYMWTEARLATNEKPAKRNISPELAHCYIEKSAELLRGWERFVQKNAQQGPVAIWGAASKGVTFALLLSQLQNATAKIACAIDLNEAKQGCYLPVSGVPVVSPKKAQDMGVQCVIIMNPNYHDEIVRMADEMGWTPKIATLNERN